MKQACRWSDIAVKSISCACSERPLVWIWYLTFGTSFPLYLFFIALAQIRLATRPITDIPDHAIREKETQVLARNHQYAFPCSDNTHIGKPV